MLEAFGPRMGSLRKLRADRLQAGLGFGGARSFGRRDGEPPGSGIRCLA